MRRLALPIAGLVTFTGLAVVAGPHEPAQAHEFRDQPSAEQCLATNPFPRSMPLTARNAFSFTERRSDGSVAYYRGAANSDGSTLSPVSVPATVAGGADLAAETAGSLTGWGRQYIVRTTGARGTVPNMTIDSYLVGEPSTARRFQNTVSGMGLEPADAVVLAAGNFRPTSASEWLSNNGLYADPDEVALAWRSPDGAGDETINVQLFKPTADGTGLTPYGTRWTTAGNVDEIEGSWSTALAVTSADMDLDGDPEVVLAYTWGGNHPTVKVDVLNVSSPDNPVLTTAATHSIELSNHIFGQLTIASGRVGPSDSDLAALGGTRTLDPEVVAVGTVEQTRDSSDSDDNRQTAQVRVLGLRHVPGWKPGRLTSTGAPVNLDELGSSERIRLGPEERGSRFSVAVDDIDPLRKPSDGSVSTYDPGSDEVIVAYGDTNERDVEVRVFNLGSSGLVERTVAAHRDIYILGGSSPRTVAVGVADMDADGDNDVMLMYSNDRGDHRSVLLTLDDWGRLRIKAESNQVAAPYSPEPGEALPMVMADVGNLTTRLVQRRGDALSSGPACVDLQAMTVMGVADPAPFWQTDGHLAWQGSTSVGQSSSVAHSQESGTTSTWGRAYSVSGGAEFSPAVFSVGSSVQFEHAWEESDAIDTTGTESFELSEGFDNSSANTQAQYAVVNYRCFYYEIFNLSGPTPIGHSRACVPLNPIAANRSDFDPTKAYSDVSSIGMQDTYGWETGADPAVQADDYSWTPYRDEWTNLTITRPATAVNLSSATTDGARAIDGGKKATSAATVSASALQSNPWWQVKLGGSADIGLVRVFPGRVDLCGAASPCEDVLHDFDVYVFDDDSLAKAGMSTLKTAAVTAGSGVTAFHVSGIPANVANVVTRTGLDDTPARGKYVRVQATAASAYLQLAEVQIYPASDKVLPPDYPSDVRQATAAEKAAAGDDNVFVATLWDPSKQTYVDRTISGKLVDMTPSPKWMRVATGACDSTQTGSWSSSRDTSTTYTHTDSTEETIGVQNDVSIGPSILKVKAGAGYKETTRTEHSDSNSAVVGSGFTIGWSRGNYCYRNTTTGAYTPGYSTAPACVYEFKPFYYMREESTNTGYQQLFPQVSYQVHMDRSKDLTDCLTNHWRRGDNVAPTAPDLSVQANGTTVIDPLAGATDGNAEDAGYLVVRGVAAAPTGAAASTATTTAGGTATVTGSKVTYQPPIKQWNSDSFYVTISDHATDSLPIKVTVSNSGAYTTGVSNGGFDAGLSSWRSTGVPGWTSGGSDGSPTAGPYASALAPAGGGASALSQTFTVPTTGLGNLTIWSRVTLQGTTNPCNGANPPPVDSMIVSLSRAGVSTSTNLGSITNRDVLPCQWRKTQYDLSSYKGLVVTLTFTAGGAPDGFSTKFDLDGVAVS